MVPAVVTERKKIRYSFCSSQYQEATWEQRASLLGARTLLVAPGITTSNKPLVTRALLLGTKGITTRSILTTSKKKLLSSVAEGVVIAPARLGVTRNRCRSSVLVFQHVYHESEPVRAVVIYDKPSRKTPESP